MCKCCEPNVDVNESMTNYVFFSPYIKRFKFWKELSSVLEERKVQYLFLPETKDYWVRDFMPIQLTSDSFAGYKYMPDYLKDKEQYITDWKPIAKRLSLEVHDSNIIIDGGNVIKAGNKVIMTDKVLFENSNISRNKLIDRIEQLFKAELILIPWDRLEPYGHADGMVRHISDNKLMLTNYCDFDKSLRNSIINCLSRNFDITELHYDVKYPSSRNWAYINFLHIGNTIVVPQLGIKEDALAIKQISDAFGTSACGINISSLLRKGGGLNCISWNIKSTKIWKNSSNF